MSLTVFQQKAVCNAYHRLTREDGSGRFLIADEVGLGKTIIAREIIRKFLEKTEKTSISVVYICSSQLLARKNLRKLVPRGVDRWKIKQFPSSRLSLLPLNEHLLNPDPREEPGNVCYFYALTPGTSLNISQGNGTVDERMMLYLLSGGKTDVELDVGSSGDPAGCDELVEKYGTRRDGNGTPTTYKGWKKLYEALHRDDQSQKQWIFLRNSFAAPETMTPEMMRDPVRNLREEIRNAEKIFEQRKILSQFGASLLKPDLVVFDEFQNYENIFIEKRKRDDEEELAVSAELDIINTVFAGLEPRPKYLLLSATPFAPLTMNEQISRGEVNLSSCDAFTRLVEWLSDSGVRSDFGKKWSDYSKGFEQYCRDRNDASFESVKNQKDQVEAMVRSVMSRTERPAGPLKNLVRDIDKKTSVLCGSTGCRKKTFFLTPRNQSCTRQLLEFEKYALRPMSAMRSDYSFVKERGRQPFFEAGSNPFKALEKEMRHPYFQCLHRALAGGDPRHGVDYSLLFWMPPTVPFYELKEPFASAHENGFSKILIFSAWRFVPRMISAAMSNHVEREIWGNDPVKSQAYRFFDSESGSGSELKAESLLDAQYGPDTSKEDIFSSPAKSVCYALRKLFGEPDSDDIGRICEIWSTKIAYALIQRMLRSDGVRILSKVWNILKKDPGLRKIFNIRNENEHVHREKLAAVYCYAGCFSAVAYEYLYLLNQESRAGKTTDRIVEICRAFYSILKLRVHPVQLDFKEKRDGDGAMKIYSERINLHFADCFSEREKNTAETDPDRKGTEKSVLPRILEIFYGMQDDSSVEEEEKLENTPIRNDILQSAFNSPFKPFVLTTTSVGQEGLDFHWYCRKIMHWNLPRNPVDFDQREGRINRFCSFALRQTLAKREAWSDGFSWPALFQDKDSSAGGMIPRWLPPSDGSTGPDRRIERIVPFFPLSREQLWLDNLIKLQGIYRMVIGQPHQEELLSLIKDLSPESQKKIGELTISLAPRCPLENLLSQPPNDDPGFAASPDGYPRSIEPTCETCGFH